MMLWYMALSLLGKYTSYCAKKIYSPDTHFLVTMGKLVLLELLSKTTPPPLSSSSSPSYIKN